MITVFLILTKITNLKAANFTLLILIIIVHIYKMKLPILNLNKNYNITKTNKIINSLFCKFS